MQVPLDPADLGRAGVEGLGPGLGQVLHPQRQLPLPPSIELPAAVSASSHPPPPRRDDREANSTIPALFPASEPPSSARRGHRAHPDPTADAAPGSSRERSLSPRAGPASDHVTKHPHEPPPTLASDQRRRPARAYGSAIGTPHHSPTSRLVTTASPRRPASTAEPKWRPRPSPAATTSTQDHQRTGPASRPPLVLKDERHARRGQGERRQHRQQQPEPGQHQAAERQPAHGGGEARAQAEPRPVPRSRRAGIAVIIAVPPSRLPRPSVWPSLSVCAPGGRPEVTLSPGYRVYPMSTRQTPFEPNPNLSSPFLR